MPTLTVWETLGMNASLRIARKMDKEERDALMTGILSSMGLAKVKNSRVRALSPCPRPPTCRRPWLFGVPGGEVQSCRVPLLPSPRLPFPLLSVLVPLQSLYSAYWRSGEERNAAWRALCLRRVGAGIRADLSCVVGTILSIDRNFS